MECLPPNHSFVNCLFDSIIQWSTLCYQELLQVLGRSTLTLLTSMFSWNIQDVLNNYGSGIASLDAGLDFMPGTTVTIYHPTLEEMEEPLLCLDMLLSEYIMKQHWSLLTIEHNSKVEPFTGNPSEITNLFLPRNCFIRYNDMSLLTQLDWQTHLTFKRQFCWSLWKNNLCNNFAYLPVGW